MPDTIKDTIDRSIRDDTDRDGLGSVVGEVVLQVDYQIIEHFSEHLYDSPNKAVEELVANGFDAFATEVRVFTPGPYTTERVIVWDNGESMDVQGLKQLWWIAKSPKSNGAREEERDGKTRKLIGKFGIGKLASYSVGGIISHLCRHGDDFYLVCIDYAQISGTDGAPPVSSEHPIRAPVIALDQNRAVTLLEGLFDTQPASLDAMLSEKSWTVAIIENLKVDDLPSGRLKWVLGNGMPLRPDFSISVNLEPVESSIKKAAAVEWDFGSTRVQDAITQRWDDALKQHEVSGGLSFECVRGLDRTAPEESIPVVRFPNLGLVWGHIRLFDETLLRYRSVDTGRSHGFFLFVRGRLLNPDDEKLFLPDPSFQTFYRSQYIIHADDLDRDLLADRQRLRRDEPSEELELLQKALAAVARLEVEARDEKREDDQSTRSILPIGSRTYYRDPLNALLLRAPIEEAHEFDPTTVDVERKPLGNKERISKVVLEENAFHVNTLHPYYAVLQKRAGQSRAAREFLRTFDLFAISERLLEGHLLDIGVDDDDVGSVVDWREGLFRTLALSYDEAPELINEMFRTSHVGHQSFERALQRVFDDMGFSAQHDGKSGEKDILVVATVGPEAYSLTIEAKGSKDDLSNDEADVGAAIRHRDRVGADHALIVTRRFVGFGPNRDNESAAILGECRSAGGVSILELEALEDLHRAVTRFSYPLSVLRDVFFTLETPAQKLKRIDQLKDPSAGFDYSELLNRIWERQGGAASGDVVAYRSIFQDGPWKADGMEFIDFTRRLIALETLAAGRIALNTAGQHVFLRQAPALILHGIERTLHGRGHDMEELKSK